jgi:hypothetical protein
MFRNVTGYWAYATDVRETGQSCRPQYFMAVFTVLNFEQFTGKDINNSFQSASSLTTYPLVDWL